MVLPRPRVSVTAGPGDVRLDHQWQPLRVRHLATLAVLTALVGGCSYAASPTASLDCRVAAAPSLAVTFGINSGGKTGHTWLLDYGDGQTSDSTSPLEATSHTYDRPGRYTARLTVTADNGTARDDCVVKVPQQ